jgi:hypothetical protein
MVGLSPSGQNAATKLATVPSARRNPPMPPMTKRPTSAMGASVKEVITATHGGTPRRLSKPTVMFFAQDEQNLSST